MNPGAISPIGGPAPAYPEGWFQVCYSDELEIGGVMRKHYFGRELVVFRTESGVVQVLNAHCVHLGANLAVGGRVIGEHIRCPFHAWEYGTDGFCKHIPYSSNVPKAAAVPAWPTHEEAGIVYFWHSAEGNDAHWDVPAIPEYGDDAWNGYLRYQWILKTTIQEVCENAVDAAHIPAVHSNGNAMPPVDYEWNENSFNFNFRFGDAGMNSSHGAAKHHGTYYGLGLSISRSEGMGSSMFLTTRTPIDENMLEVRYAMLTAVSTPEDPTGEISLLNAQHVPVEFAKDIDIWENKVYLPTPMVCTGDGPIGPFRRWARNFFPKSDFPHRSAVENMAEVQHAAE